MKRESSMRTTTLHAKYQVAMFNIAKVTRPMSKFNGTPLERTARGSMTIPRVFFENSRANKMRLILLTECLIKVST